VRDITEKLERNAKDIRFGSVGVELKIHNGKIVSQTFTSSEMKLEKIKTNNKETENVN